VSEYTNPQPDEEPAISRFKAAFAARGASGTLLWFAILTAIIIALTLVANQWDNDDDAGPGPTASSQNTNDDQGDADATVNIPTSATDTDSDNTTADPSNNATSDDQIDADDADEKAAPTPTPEAPAALASVDAFVDGGTATLAGLIADRATADGLVAAAEGVLGQGAIVDELEIDPEARSERATL
jgi:hypothetical protein